MFDYSNLLSSILFSLAHLHLPLRIRIFFCIRVFTHPRICLGQTSLQDFACNLLLGKPRCRTLLAIYLWANIIAGLCSQSTFGQRSSQDFARNPSMGKTHCRTLLAIHPWANIIAGLHLRSTFGQTSLQNSTREPPLVNLIYP